MKTAAVSARRIRPLSRDLDGNALGAMPIVIALAAFSLALLTYFA